jgi:transposase
MNNYTTLKSKFLTISDKLRNSEYFSLEIDGYYHNCGFEDETNIYIKYISASSSTLCKACNNTITRNKGKRNATILLGVFNGKPVIGNFEKNIYFCGSCNKQSVDRITNVQDHNTVSSNITKYAVKLLAENNSTYSQVARHIGISVSTIIRAFDQTNFKEINLTDYSNIGIDEIRFTKASGNYQCTIYDAETGIILDILANRELKTVKSYLTSNFQHLEYLNQDLWITYKNAGIAANADVKIVADMFHVVRTCTWAFSRTRVSHFKKYGNKTKLRWRTLNYGLSKLDAHSKSIVKYKISKDQHIQKAHHAKEMFMAACRSKSKYDFDRIYESFLKFIIKHNLDEFKPIIVMVKNWYNEITTAIETGMSNGISERRNSDFKQAKRNSRGFTNLPRASKLIKYRINSKIIPKYYAI